MKLKVVPATPATWPALADLFCDSTVCQRCSCMYWRIGPAYRKRSARANQHDFQAIVAAGPPPGLIALEGDRAVGWCQLGPRNDVPHLDREWRLKRVDDLPVWSLTCFYVRKSHRRRGITSHLIDAAIVAARRAKAPALEAYPLDHELSQSSTWTGFASTFARAGFRIVGRHVPPRPIMRHDLKRR